MTNHYELLGITRNASPREIKRAFRERAKLLHPDIAGENAAEEMRKLLAAYEILSDPNRRFEYDRAYERFAGKFRGKDPWFASQPWAASQTGTASQPWDYRSFLKERKDDPGSQAKLIFFELLHLEENIAIAIWREQGGLDFPMKKYLDREDWMDCTYILAEELAKRRFVYESFVLLVSLVEEERRRPYFRHFMEEVENFLKELVRLHLRSAVDEETYVECMEALMNLGFSHRDEARWMRSMAETLVMMGEIENAEKVFREALKRDPSLPNTVQLRRKLRV